MRRFFLSLFFLVCAAGCLNAQDSPNQAEATIYIYRGGQFTGAF